MEEPREMKYLPRPGDIPRGIHALAILHNSGSSEQNIWGYHLALSESRRLGTPISFPGPAQEEPAGLYALFNTQRPCSRSEFVKGFFGRYSIEEARILSKANITPLEVKGDSQDLKTTVSPQVMVDNVIGMTAHERIIQRGM